MHSKSIHPTENVAPTHDTATSGFENENKEGTLTTPPPFSLSADPLQNQNISKKEDEGLENIVQRAEPSGGGTTQREPSAYAQYRRLRRVHSSWGASANFLSGQTFLGIAIDDKIHKELKVRLDEVESHLLGKYPGKSLTEIGSILNIKDLKGSRMPTGGSGTTLLSFHSIGLALDINYGQNPYIGYHNDAGNKKSGNGRTGSYGVLKRAGQFIYGSGFDAIKWKKKLDKEEGLNRKARRRGEEEQSVSDDFDVLERANDAIRAYFAYHDNPEKIKEKLKEMGMPHEEEDVNKWLVQIAKDRQNRGLIEDFRKGGSSNIRPIDNGFMDLSRDLVTALVDIGHFRWGAGSTNKIDLMHFSYEEGTVTRSARSRNKRKLARGE